jgi:hypothetical protein
MPVYPDNRIELECSLCVCNAKFVYASAGGTYSNHCALQIQYNLN